VEEPVLYVATTLSLISLVLLMIKPLWGVFGIFIARPLVDATWDQSLILDFKLTEILSSLVPLIIFVRMIVDDGSRRPFKDMPLKWIWLVYSIDSVLFSSMVMFDDDWRAGLSVLMRHLNGLAGFYMVQAYCRSERDFLRFAWAMAIAGLFPMATGVLENVTGVHWRITTGEDDVVRNIGLYHDAITIRYYAQQTIMSLLLIFAIGKRSAVVSAFCLLYGLAAVFVLKGAYSKSGFLTLGAWMLLWPLLRKNAKAAVGMAAAVVAVALYYSKEVVKSFGFVFANELAAVQGTGELHSTFAGRWGIWQDMAREWESLGLIAHIFGTGHMANGAHNDYLQVLFHGGWLGLGIYAALLCAVGWAIGRLLWQRLDIWAIAALFVFIMWMVDTIGLIPSAYSGYQWFVWGIIGFSLRYRQDERLRVHTDILPATPHRFQNLLGAA
jgi:O-antigen ligase